MPIEMQQYSPEFMQEWDDFVSKSNNGTLFHLRKFLNYHPAGRFEDMSVVFTRKGKVCAVVPAAVRKFEGESVFYSHPGASYGGLVEPLLPPGLKETLQMVQLIIVRTRELQCKRIIITIPPSYYSMRYSSHMECALTTYGFTYRVRELSSVLSLDTSAEDIYKSFPESVKRALRKAEKSGLRVRQSDDIESYFTILQNNLEMRHNVTPTHTLPELKRLLDLFPDRIKLYAAYINGKMIGGVVTFGCNARVNLAFYIAHNHTYQTYRTVDYLIWRLIQESITSGYLYLDFGTFTLREQPNWGLCRFKEKFGARGVFRDTLERRI